MDVEALLIGYTITTNDYKQEVKAETTKSILAQKQSISRSEFYNGGKAGLQPAFVLVTSKLDYSGELEVELDGVRYGIYRTYEVDEDYIELYCERKGGYERPASGTE